MGASDDALRLRRPFLLLESHRRRGLLVGPVNAIALAQHLSLVGGLLEARLHLRGEPRVAADADEPAHASEIDPVVLAAGAGGSFVGRSPVRGEPLGPDVLGLPPRRHGHVLLLQRSLRGVTQNIHNLLQPIGLAHEDGGHDLQKRSVLRGRTSDLELRLEVNVDDDPLREGTETSQDYISVLVIT